MASLGDGGESSQPLPASPADHSSNIDANRGSEDSIQQRVQQALLRRRMQQPSPSNQRQALLKRIEQLNKNIQGCLQQPLVPRRKVRDYIVNKILDPADRKLARVVQTEAEARRRVADRRAELQAVVAAVQAQLDNVVKDHRQAKRMAAKKPEQLDIDADDLDDDLGDLEDSDLDDSNKQGNSNKNQDSNSNKNQDTNSNKNQDNNSNKNQDNNSNKNQDNSSNKNQDNSSNNNQDNSSNKNQDKSSNKNQDNSSNKNQDNSSNKNQDNNSNKNQGSNNGKE